ncbi:putative phosphatase [Aspergillus clavatus NRRL 1]|uniref:ADP-ribose 1''-phosphate phosphatase n=1 Tax=Aspergillus clavatus (strain ATCC 1007 / CBS 513.65 / DSM 816 / NCTC 3887 / NRRL 1 / QM 1276 / 107) TaxID=344612 RepID=POA1_ASPCL|nr:phosphatase, putative [Aspergillus clavatus NRRL 1]A1CNH7.1 RecName: Full=ADP-ribose 1''-phosphate phosphatase [Aspergillus clavatus NRRL 1]EAW07198.1 phosphatase, putative [Aspergillus clavatus NRRL 1]
MAHSPIHGRITETEGDLFDAPDGAALIHACNCQGSWGKGIAQAFKNKYPAAFTIYRAHCQNLLSKASYRTVNPVPDEGSLTGNSRKVRLPEGTALVIPPQEHDHMGRHKKHWIICLFTSRGFGRGVSSPAVIIQNTELAVVDMRRQIAELHAEEGLGGFSGELWSCRFNSGLFGVDWALSRKVLEDAGLEVTVVSPREG